MPLDFTDCHVLKCFRYTQGKTEWCHWQLSVGALLSEKGNFPLVGICYDFLTGMSIEFCRGCSAPIEWSDESPPSVKWVKWRHLCFQGRWPYLGRTSGYRNLHLFSLFGAISVTYKVSVPWLSDAAVWPTSAFRDKYLTGFQFLLWWLV